MGSRGWRKGQHKPYVQGHYPRPADTSNADKQATGPIGTSGYHAVHQWMARHFPKTGVCEQCGKRRGRKAHDYASIGHTYTRDRADWRELCKPCHAAMDGGE